MDRQKLAQEHARECGAVVTEVDWASQCMKEYVRAQEALIESEYHSVKEAWDQVQEDTGGPDNETELEKP